MYCLERRRSNSSSSRSMLDANVSAVEGKSEEMYEIYYVQRKRKKRKRQRRKRSMHRRSNDINNNNDMCTTHMLLEHFTCSDGNFY